jgi:glycosyltransferase involved in cell wall biosynthesis
VAGPRERKLRVVFVTHVARLSGAEIGLVRFVASAPDRLAAIVILAEDGPLVPVLSDAGARVEVLPLAERARGTRRADIRPGAPQALAAAHLLAYVARLSVRLSALRPDLVHSNSLKSGVYGALAARAAGRPALWHLHDHLTPEYLGADAARVMRRLITTLPHAIAAPSRTAVDSIGCIPHGMPVEVVPLPIPQPSSPVNVRDAVHCVGIVGRLTPWKGQDVFLRAFARAFPDGEVRARVVGSAVFGEEAYELELRSLARELGIADRVDFTGFQRDVEAELRRIDLLVHASVLPDPLTTVVLEGLAAGVPTISSDAGGHAAHVRRKEAGLLFPPRDVDGLTAQLRRAAADRALRLALRERGLELARDFEPASAVARLLAFYDRILRVRRSLDRDARRGVRSRAS